MSKYQHGYIKVEVWQDRMGNILVRPISDKWTKRFVDIVVHNGGPNEDTAFFQAPHGDEFIEEYVPQRYRTHLKMGYAVRFMADPWVVGHWYGYDAHLAAE